MQMLYGSEVPIPVGMNDRFTQLTLLCGRTARVLHIGARTFLSTDLFEQKRRGSLSMAPPIHDLHPQDHRLSKNRNRGIMWVGSRSIRSFLC